MAEEQKTGCSPSDCAGCSTQVNAEANRRV